MIRASSGFIWGLGAAALHASVGSGSARNVPAPPSRPRILPSPFPGPIRARQTHGFPDPSDGPAPVSTEADSSASARARAQAVLQAALESSADALLVTDEAGRAESGNQRFLALFGLSAAELAAQGADDTGPPAGEPLPRARSGGGPDRIAAGVDRRSQRHGRAGRRTALRALLAAGVARRPSASAGSGATARSLRPRPPRRRHPPRRHGRCASRTSSSPTSRTRCARRWARCSAGPRRCS